MNPHYNTWLPCVNIDTKNQTALVRSNRTGKTFPVHVPDNLIYLISRRDKLHVVKSHVSGEWIVIDYMAMYGMTAGDEEEVNVYEY